MSEATEPIRRSIVVSCPVEDAFRVFTDEMTTWWPLHTHSRAADQDEDVKAERVEFQGRVGGRLIEHLSNEEQLPWGEVLVWEPPNRLTIAWKPNASADPPTELEVSFTPDEAGTRVDLEHRGWERLGDLAGQARADYAGEGGWVTVFDRLYGQAANTRVA